MQDTFYCVLQRRFKWINTRYAMQDFFDKKQPGRFNCSYTMQDTCSNFFDDMELSRFN